MNILIWKTTHLKKRYYRWVEINDEKKRIGGKGELDHIDQSGDFACMIGMTINLKLYDFNINIPRLENEVEIVITQALLKTGKN